MMSEPVTILLCACIPRANLYCGTAQRCYRDWQRARTPGERAHHQLAFQRHTGNRPQDVRTEERR